MSQAPAQIGPDRYAAHVIIEFLTFTVDPTDQPEWLAVDERIWTRYLQRQPGFVRKQMWVARDRPHEVNAMIQWADEQSWKALSGAELAALDAKMGAWWRASSLRVFDVASDITLVRSKGLEPPTF